MTNPLRARSTALRLRSTSRRACSTALRVRSTALGVCATALLVCTTLARPVTAAAATPAPPTLRLDDRARPTRYAVRLDVDPALPTFRGEIDVDLVLARATDLVWLNATGLRVRKATFTVNGSTIVARVVPGGDDFLGFASARQLPAGAARLHVEYQGTMARSDDRGLMAQKEGGRWYAVTQLEAIFARRVFPCFDEPSLKVPWQLTLEVPKALTAVSNTAIVSAAPGRADHTVVRFAETPPLPSYLVAFAVGPYEVVDAGKAGGKHTALRVFAPAGRGRDARYATAVSGTLLELLETYFGIPFPFDKLDNVTIPITSTFEAMENVGMVTWAQRYLIAKPTNQSLAFERDYAATAAHEYAHQWFGDLVTTAWWDDIWLNESFASWMESKIVDQYKPEWSHGTSYVDARTEALAKDTLLSARQIRQPIASNDDIYNAFDEITYQKGESVLAMFERFVGAETFRAGIRQYLRAHANGSATADDFIAAIADAARRPEVAPAFKSFLDQAGTPLVDVALQCQAGRPPRLAVKQQRFLPLGSRGAPPQTWQIPMCVRWATGGGAEQRSCALVTRPEESLALGSAPGCPTWLLANDGELGYYRAAYPRALLQSLLGRDGRRQLSLAELDGLVDDLRALVDAGRLPLAEALALVPSLAEDPRRQVQAGLVDFVHDLDDHVVSDAARPAYARFIARVFGARAHALGWTPRPGEDEDTRLLRPALVSLVADQGEDAELRRQARVLADRWLGDRKAVDPDVARALLHVAAYDGDRALFDRMRAEARRTDDRHDRELLLATLGDFRDPALAQAALGVVGDRQLDARETTAILDQQAGDRRTRAAAWQYTRTHFDELVRRLSPELMVEAPLKAASFCDEPHEQEMIAFFKERSPRLPGGPRLLAQAREQAELCRAAVAAQRPSLDSFLARY